MTEEQRKLVKATAEVWLQQRQKALQKADVAFREWLETGNEEAWERKEQQEKNAAEVDMKLADLMSKFGR